MTVRPEMRALGMKNEESRSTHWDLMLATAKEIAARDGSHDRLKEEFLEEFGRLPTSELLDYFDDLLKSDIAGQAPGAYNRNEIEAPGETTDPEMVFAEKMATKKKATVLGFRQAYEAAYGKEPELELVAYFLKRLAYRKRKSNTPTTAQKKTTEIQFVKDFTASNSPTILTFRQGFKKMFGRSPHSELITLFLNELSTRQVKKPS